MNDFEQSQPHDAFFTKRIRAGKRTYFFDVKATRANDYYLTITESKKKPGESEDQPVFEKHKLFLYKEDFEKFMEGLNDSLQYIRGKQGNNDNSFSNNSSINVNEAPIDNSETMKSSFTDVDFDDLSK